MGSKAEKRPRKETFPGLQPTDLIGTEDSAIGILDKRLFLGELLTRQTFLEQRISELLLQLSIQREKEEQAVETALAGAPALIAHAQIDAKVIVKMMKATSAPWTVFATDDVTIIQTSSELIYVEEIVEILVAFLNSLK